LISKIGFKNFKCYDDISIKLSPLNVFTGLNGMGKSTVIQGLLCLRQSYMENKTMAGLYLNGKYTELGNGKDVLCEKAEGEPFIGVSLSENKKEYEYVYAYDAISKVLKSSDISSEKEVSEAISTDQFVYLSANRIVPRIRYDLGNVEDVDERDFGKTGEFAIQYMDKHGADQYAGSDRSDLNVELDYWLQEITPGVSPVINVDQDKMYSDLRFEFREGNMKTSPYRAINVGFGLTYVLPVIVSLLTARPGDYIIIENPEAHIHPRGQRRLGELIARAISYGAQIIVETHSDHLMNGIRLSVKREEISKEKVNFVYFYKDETTYDHNCIYPKIDENGKIDHWPKGFFDEWDECLMELI